MHGSNPQLRRERGVFEHPGRIAHMYLQRGLQRIGSELFRRRLHGDGPKCANERCLGHRVRRQCVPRARRFLHFDMWQWLHLVGLAAVMHSRDVQPWLGELRRHPLHSVGAERTYKR